MPEDRLSGEVHVSNYFSRQLTSSLGETFFPSTRNSDEAYVHLLKETACSKFFFSEERSARVLEVQALCPSLMVFQVPIVKDMMNDEAGLRSYPYHQDYAEVEDQTSCIIHSSGTTGKLALAASSDSTQT